MLIVDPIPFDDMVRAEERQHQLSDYVAGRLMFRGQRDLTKEEAETALANLRTTLQGRS